MAKQSVAFHCKSLMQKSVKFFKMCLRCLAVQYYFRLNALQCLAFLYCCLALPCLVLPCNIVPKPAFHCLCIVALLWLALPCLAVLALLYSWPALQRIAILLPCLAVPYSIAVQLACLAVGCLALQWLAVICFAVPLLALPRLDLHCLAPTCNVLPCCTVVLPCIGLHCLAVQLACFAVSCPLPPFRSFLLSALPCLAVTCLAVP